jgi:hypothetical protein
MRYITNKFTSHILRPTGKSTYCAGYRSYWARESEPSQPLCVTCERRAGRAVDDPHAKAVDRASDLLAAVLAIRYTREIPEGVLALVAQAHGELHR